ncbi:Radical SAM family enzyme, similar to coproporphyrinogen III oxidase, oxygen-independent, clustered with nucleoside-triphosphatase RdgB [invertebrate metagenome]|uniref:Radical SAM family enzyme, similar to coproporphyrinogen III oxidase, oxygen-independent, clustered with nucleoside-triphosphatase RdgB n=1 Tax=invertebrate metagenome TaxID=1711999 RepID=A0A484HAE3_9ZZZZ
MSEDLIHGTQHGLGLYIHWPFCIHKCPYCAFNSRVTTAVNHEGWRWALRLALDHEVASMPKGHILKSVFFGGGTPSLMDPATVATVLDQAAVAWPIAADVEVTLEANPGTVDRDRLTDFRVAGVNRLSLGVQALDDRALRWLGRIHDTRQAIAAIDLARHFFPQLSFDLIYARPGQTLEAWRQELELAIALTADHLSLYQLTIEPGTAFSAYQARGALLVLPDEDTAADFYQMTQDVTAIAGLPAYEISNHARPGAECFHNVTAWQGGDIVGIGPGAHGRLSGFQRRNTIATRQHQTPAVWLARVESCTHRTVSYLSPEERLEELVVMGLRLTAGIDRTIFYNLVGRPLESIFSLQTLERLAEFVTLDAAGLRVTSTGRLVLDEILRQILV